MIRFFFLLVSYVFILSCQFEPRINKTKSWDPSKLQVAFLIMHGTYNTELIAPYDVFQHTKYRSNIQDMEVFMVAKKKEIIITFEGIKLIPDYSYLHDSLPPIDILVIPSAVHHLDKDLEDDQMLNWVKKVAKETKYVTSHCDGAFVLAKAGLLDSVVSTTFPSDISKMRNMFPHLNIMDSTWFVHDGKFITSAGGARSYEASLYLTEHLYGSNVAKEIAKGLVIDWNLAQVPHIIIRR